MPLIVEPFESCCWQEGLQLMTNWVKRTLRVLASSSISHHDCSRCLLIRFTFTPGPV